MDEKDPLDGYLRVTKVLWPFAGLDHIDPAVLSKAAERGTKVHRICEGIISGLGEFGVDEETAPYVESFKQWWNLGHEVFLMEERFFCDKYKITGQVDLILKTEDGLVLVDLKTSRKPSKSWQAQGSAYVYLAREAGFDVKKVFFLHLSREGKAPKLLEYDPDPSFFLSVLTVYNHFYADQYAEPRISRTSRQMETKSSQSS